MRRTLLAVVLVLAATGAGIAAASAFVSAPPAFETAPPHLLPGPAELVVGARVPPSAGGPEWAVRTYMSRTGLLCAERGRLSGGVFGDLGEDGEFQPRPAGPTGLCGDPQENAVIAGIEQAPARGEEPARTFVIGASLRRPTSVTVAADGAPPTELEAGQRGAFIGAFPGLRDARDLPLEVTLADGTVVSFDWVGEPSERRGRP
jgi:hypothetical protein